MKGLKKIALVIFAVVIAHFAVAQDHDAPVFSGNQVDTFKQIQLYPNPAVEYLIVRFSEPQAQTVKLTIHSIIGNPVEVDRENVDQHEIRIRVKDLPSGYYFLAVKNEQTNQRSSFKFLKR